MRWQEGGVREDIWGETEKAFIRQILDTYSRAFLNQIILPS